MTATTTSNAMTYSTSNRYIDNNEDEDNKSNTKIGLWRCCFSPFIYFCNNSCLRDTFPRTHGILFHIIIPLWELMGMSIFLGYLLAKCEIGDEIERNDKVMRWRYNLLNATTTKLKESGLHDTSISAICSNQLLHYSNNKLSNNSSSNNELNNMASSLVVMNNTVSTEFYMKICEDIGKETMKDITNLTALKIKEASAYNAMTFHWMRCWNTTLYGSSNGSGGLNGSNPIMASVQQTIATQFKSQNDFYQSMWDINRKELYQQYLVDFNCSNTSSIMNNTTTTNTTLTKYNNNANNTTTTTTNTISSSCQQNAFDESILNATGSLMCGVNTPASAWFWFVFMTTVGYGNQSPVTHLGRILTGCVGWITILIFAILQYMAGQVMEVIINDMLQKAYQSFLKIIPCRAATTTTTSTNTANNKTNTKIKAIYSFVMWGIIALLWVYGTARLALIYFNYTELPYDTSTLYLFQEQNSTFTEGDAYWFSYISLLTVGLGDFYLPSESIFYLDLFVWSSCFLIGFTFLSAVIGNSVEIFGGYLPDFGERFKERLVLRDNIHNMISTTTTTTIQSEKNCDVEEDEEVQGGDGERTKLNNMIENPKLIKDLIDEKTKEIVTIQKNDYDDDVNVDLLRSDEHDHNLNRIHKKKRALLRLLQETNNELEHYQRHPQHQYQHHNHHVHNNILFPHPREKENEHESILNRISSYN